MSSGILSSSSLQIWDNAAFDDSACPGPLRPISLNFDADDPLKENRSPAAAAPKNPKRIDAEIAEIETEIIRLSKKLEVLKLKKAQISAASKTPAPAHRRAGRIVPAKFLNHETPPPPPLPSSASKKIQDSGRRRGVSLGPAEIYSNTTPFRAQKSSLQKLNGIKEEKEKEKMLGSARRRGMSLGPSEILRQPSRRSASPKIRKPMNSRVSELRNGIATVGSKKQVKMDEEKISGIMKPKALFQEKKRPAAAAAKVRIVASRYNDEGSSKRRKWSLPETDKEADEKNTDRIKKRAFSLGGANVRGLEEKEQTSPCSIMKIAEALPKIRTMRAAVESPRDSGCAKRVADLVGRRSCFAEDDCQSLSFEDGYESSL